MTTYQAKTVGQGDKVVHTYFPSIRWPGLYHRLCRPTGRLWEPNTLRFKQTQDHGWSRECPACNQLKATTEAIDAEAT